MKPKKRQKMCYNCEGEIDLDVIVCPFCAADLREEKPEQMRASYSPFNSTGKASNETSNSLYPPPYPVKKEAVVVPEAAMIEEVMPEEKPLEDASQQGNLSRVIRPTILFTLGIQLFLLGMFILLFSHKGIVLLKWDGTYWFFYVFASFPLLYFGYKSLSKIE
ncbi:MAG: hypothetical protein JSS32_00710 [Verrucomicrobia bacterium]|nr:hypothetical protein [Verrucomicrobiota bacterium]